MYRDFVHMEADGTVHLRKRCGERDCTSCGNLGEHLKERRGVRGEGHRHDTATYPDLLCSCITMSMNLDVVAAMNRDGGVGKKRQRDGTEGSTIGGDDSYSHCCTKWDRAKNQWLVNGGSKWACRVAL